MTRKEAMGSPSARFPGGDEQHALVTHLIRTCRTMRSIDELFSWITTLVVQRYHARAAQIWAMQQIRQGSYFPKLRGIATQDQFLSHLLIASPQMTEVAEIALREGKIFASSAVDAIFPPAFAEMLHQYRLHYFTGLFLRSTNSLLPPVGSATGEQIPTPLALSFFLFYQQMPLQQDDLMIDNFFHDIVPIARGCGLLQAAEVAPFPVPPPLTERRADNLFELIPHRNEDPADNPLASSVAIKDERARRFYKTINDRRTVRALCRQARLEEKEAAGIVQQLLVQSRITLCRSDGEPVEYPALDVVSDLSAHWG